LTGKNFKLIFRVREVAMVREKEAPTVLTTPGFDYQRHPEFYGTESLSKETVSAIWGLRPKESFSQYIKGFFNSMADIWRASGEAWKIQQEERAAEKEAAKPRPRQA
jgi:hypothetical protein